MSVTFSAQSSRQCALISIVDDDIVEHTESFTVTAGVGVFPGGNTQIVYIVDNDGKQAV